MEQPMTRKYEFFKGCNDADTVPKAWLHVIHMELDQKTYILSFSPENPWGEPGKDYSPEYIWEKWELNFGRKVEA